MMSSDIVAAVMPVIDALEALDVPYQIGGSIASSVMGIARSTLDVDLVARLEEEHILPLVRQLESQYYVEEATVREALTNESSFNLIHTETMLKVDVFVLKRRLYDQESFARRTVDSLEEGPQARSVYFAAPEDIILNKLEWYRMGGHVSERQWGDVIGVLKVQHDHLDYQYLKRWSRALNVEDLLAAALHAVTNPDPK